MKANFVSYKFKIKNPCKITILEDDLVQKSSRTNHSFSELNKAFEFDFLLYKFFYPLLAHSVTHSLTGITFLYFGLKLNYLALYRTFLRLKKFGISVWSISYFYFFLYFTQFIKWSNLSIILLITYNRSTFLNIMLSSIFSCVVGSAGVLYTLSQESRILKICCFYVFYYICMQWF